MTTGKINQIARQIDRGAASRETRRRPRAAGQNRGRSGRPEPQPLAVTASARHRVAQAKDDAPTGRRARRVAEGAVSPTAGTRGPAVAERPTDGRGPDILTIFRANGRQARGLPDNQHTSPSGAQRAVLAKKARAALARAPETTSAATATRRASVRRHNNCQGREPGDPEAGLLPRWPEAHKAAGGLDSRESPPNRRPSRRSRSTNEAGRRDGKRGAERPPDNSRPGGERPDALVAKERRPRFAERPPVSPQCPSGNHEAKSPCSATEISERIGPSCPTGSREPKHP